MTWLRKPKATKVAKLVEEEEKKKKKEKEDGIAQILT